MFHFVIVSAWRNARAGLFTGRHVSRPKIVFEGLLFLAFGMAGAWRLVWRATQDDGFWHAGGGDRYRQAW
jgi:hypothetical protein